MNTGSVEFKSSLRKEIRALRRSLTEEQQSRAAQGLLNQLLTIPYLDDSKAIAMYLVNDGEIDPCEVMAWCWQHKKRPFVPIVSNSNSTQLRFAEIKQDSDFAENKFGISEPVIDESELVSADQLDLVLMPLVAFDCCGNRLGMGGGFYDTTFDFIRTQNVSRPVLIGIAHELQKVDRILSESWDIPLSIVVTDSQIYNIV